MLDRIESVHANIVETNGAIDILSPTSLVTQLLEVRRTFALVLDGLQKHSDQNRKQPAIAIKLARAADSKCWKALVLLIGAELAGWTFVRN